jgi:hypothetical protein
LVQWLNSKDNFEILQKLQMRSVLNFFKKVEQLKKSFNWPRAGYFFTLADFLCSTDSFSAKKDGGEVVLG